jgi:predicted DNA-binding mobile mystery protein A
MNAVHDRARKRLDERLAAFKEMRQESRPPKGWIRALRDALGMSGSQLGKRVGVSAQTVERIEKSEAAGTIQLSTLRRAAEALDCTLVYALVPNTSLESMVKARAREIALRDLGRVSHTMKLEAQQTTDRDFEARIDAYIREVLKDRDLWKTS